jgi:hypothetical protein
MSQHISWIRTQDGNSLIAPSIQDYNIKTFPRSQNYNSWEDFAKFFSEGARPRKKCRQSTNDFYRMYVEMSKKITSNLEGKLP